MAAKKLKEIKFVKAPTGRFGLAYFAGDVVKLKENQADDLITAGYAIDTKDLKAAK